MCVCMGGRRNNKGIKKSAKYPHPAIVGCISFERLFRWNFIFFRDTHRIGAAQVCYFLLSPSLCIYAVHLRKSTLLRICTIFYFDFYCSSRLPTLPRLYPKNPRVPRPPVYVCRGIDFIQLLIEIYIYNLHISFYSPVTVFLSANRS